MRMRREFLEVDSISLKQLYLLDSRFLRRAQRRRSQTTKPAISVSNLDPLSCEIIWTNSRSLRDMSASLYSISVI